MEIVLGKTIFFLKVKHFFIVYAITVVPTFPLYPLPPAHPLEEKNIETINKI